MIFWLYRSGSFRFLHFSMNEIYVLLQLGKLACSEFHRTGLFPQKNLLPYRVQLLFDVTDLNGYFMVRQNVAIYHVSFAIQPPRYVEIEIRCGVLHILTTIMSKDALNPCVTIVRGIETGRSYFNTGRNSSMSSRIAWKRKARSSPTLKIVSGKTSKQRKRDPSICLLAPGVFRNHNRLLESRIFSDRFRKGRGR